MFGVLKIGKLGASMKRAGFNPSTLFAASEPGAWYDPSDMSTLFQDSAGTVPVTAVEQPVGCILDKSGRGNHATQATTTKRPVYSRRVNQFTNTHFSGAVAGSPGTAPTGWSYVLSTGALGLGGEGILSFTTSGARSSISQAFSTSPNASYALSAKVNANSGLPLSQILAFNQGLPGAVEVWRANGAVVSQNSYVPVAGDLITGTLHVAGSAGVINPRIGVGASGVVTGSVSISQPSLTLATDAHLPYQRVNTASDYDADPSKFPAYLRADGVDDSLASSTGGGGTTGFFFSAAVTVSSNNGWRILFSDAGANTGYMVRLNPSNQLELLAGNGSAYAAIATANSIAIGATAVVQAWDDGTNLNVKIGNGPTAYISRPVVASGTVGFTMGQNNGVNTGYFNGRSYGEIYRKDSSPTQAQREAVALYQRQKARIA